MVDVLGICPRTARQRKRANDFAPVKEKEAVRKKQAGCLRFRADVIWRAD